MGKPKMVRVTVTTVEWESIQTERAERRGLRRQFPVMMLDEERELADRVARYHNRSLGNLLRYLMKVEAGRLGFAEPRALPEPPKTDKA